MMRLQVYLMVVSLLLLVGCSTKQPTEYKKDKRYNKSAMKSYKVKGKRYYPKKVKLGEKSYGISSWYGPKFHGKLTSNGERYNMYAGTAAHKTWPMDTVVKVTNLKNQKSTIVRINDRGPFISGRIIDCSYAAGKKLGLDKSGIAKVKLEVIGPKHLTKLEQSSSQETVAAINTSSKYGLQIAAFNQYDGARNIAENYERLPTGYKPMIKKQFKNGETLYKVIVGGFKNENELFAFKKRYKLTQARVVAL